MNLRNYSTAQKSIFVILLVVFIIVGGFILLHPHKKNATKVNEVSSIPKEAIEVASDYLQAQENSVGADQSTPNDWLKTVEPITTSEWFSALQPNDENPTGSMSNDYRVAHDSHFVVKVTVSSCSIAGSYSQNGTVLTIVCGVVDQTISYPSKAIVPSNELPFGWVHVGQQPAPTLQLIKQSGKWLVNNVTVDQESAE